MIRYFQLTPDILLEYIYEGDPKLNEDGIKGNNIDIKDIPTMMLDSKAFLSKYLFFKNESEGMNSLPNLVLPLNNTETQFVIAKNNYQNFYSKNNIHNRFITKTNSGYIYEYVNYDKDIIKEDKSCDVKYDKCVIHFTSKNFFGSYDSLIFQTYVYLSDKSKLYFASFLFKKTTNLELKSEHLLYNEKLYTTQVEFDIPSVYAIFTEDNKVFNEALKNQNIELLENTPIGVNVYGVSGSIKGTDNYVKLKTSKINSIYIPYIYNRLDEIHIDISEATEEGDFYYINPNMGSNDLSFADYIKRMGEDIRAYMIMHELCLRESWVDNDGKYHSENTHKEFHIIDINDGDEDEDISKKFDARIKYRPICTQGGSNYIATIIDTIKIINTVDSSSYEVVGSLDIKNPYKYGKRLKRLNIKNDSRPIVNVYNKNISGNGTSNSSVDSDYGSGTGLNSVSNYIPGNITGEITIYIEGIGYITATISGYINEKGELICSIISETGEVWGTITGKVTPTTGEIYGRLFGSYTHITSVSSGDGSGSGSGSEFVTTIYTIKGEIRGNLSDLGMITCSVTGAYTYSSSGSGSGDGSGDGSGSGSGDGSGSGSGGSGDGSGSSGSISGTGSGIINDTKSYLKGQAKGTSSNLNSNNGYGSNSNGVLVLNKGGGFVIENMSQNITSFIECTNVGVSILELSPDNIN